MRGLASGKGTQTRKGVRMISEIFRRKSIDQIHRDLAAEQAAGGSGLKKDLTLFDLVCFGIAAIIGAGIFSTIGTAASQGGPAVCLLFILTAVACLFSALCYAEFASTVPISGSAYTYSYTAFGEIIAWVIGWNLLMEYAIGNSTVAFSWSQYFTNVVEGTGFFQIPDWLETDFYSCYLAAKEEARVALEGGVLAKGKEELLAIWKGAPRLGGWPIILDVPALAINVVVTALVVIGIKESKIASNLMVLLKISVVILVILVGMFYVKPENWSPFAPHGMSGVLKGIAGVFFAYIGFDAISTTSEECRDAKRDLPRATILTLVICTILYVIISLVLTGMVSYKTLNVADPLAEVFKSYENLGWMTGLVSVSAVVAMTSVFLVFQLGQPRIWMSMARDGLLPKRFASIHPRFKTPVFSTILTGIVVAIPTLLLNLDVVTNMVSIGTLFAFLLVSAGVLVMEKDPGRIKHASFRVPYVNGGYVVPVLFLVYLGVAIAGYLPANHFILGEAAEVAAPHDWLQWVAQWTGVSSDLVHLWFDRIPYLLFLIVFAVMAVASIVMRLSAIPVLGVVTNLYLIAGLGWLTWVWFAIWCSVGVIVYFGYGYWHSKLRGAEGMR